MKLDDLFGRCKDGEVCLVETIEDIPADEFYEKNRSLFGCLTVENDVEQAGILWVYDRELRNDSK